MASNYQTHTLLNIPLAVSSAQGRNIHQRIHHDRHEIFKESLEAKEEEREEE
jgi:hypothetical protein